MININDHRDEEDQEIKEKLNESTSEQAKAMAHIYLTKRVTSLVAFIALLIASVGMSYVTKSPRWLLLMIIYILF
ncbi:hypothetical protein N6G95_09600 [Pediococcus inopinatus]|uniref:hypothetical protein n=1 Tax=Pediococcus inopinatus TaxID=114090 RepID=UPI002B25EA75|nr:hypothetical protein [Pediococcus inopinatus]WPC19457.1 hypothetical protein N6G95_09600 [Pediococcus inopinatus]